MVFSSPVIENCTIEGNQADWFSGGGIYISSGCNPVFTNCIINDNTSGTNQYGDNQGGGILIWNDSHPVFQNCDISGNYSMEEGGGVYCHETEADFVYCTFIENSCESEGGVIYSQGGILNIDRCTFSGNASEDGYCIILINNTSTTITNTIIEGCQGRGAVNFNGSQTADLTYSDFYNNENGNFSGYYPPGIGELTTVNANGDSCDLYNNILLDPMFLDPLNGDFHLQEGSPCIDAGDPSSPLDPDSTIADMGAYYYHQTAWVKPTTENLPLEYSINAFPNPFNQRVALNFALPAAVKSSIDVYDINGRKVTTLVNKLMPAGQHSVVFDAEGLTSGIYFARFQTVESTQTSRLILIK